MNRHCQCQHAETAEIACGSIPIAMMPVSAHAVHFSSNLLLENPAPRISLVAGRANRLLRSDVDSADVRVMDQNALYSYFLFLVTGGVEDAHTQ
jgi:hypothetical protein